ncbi:hypothetical protein NA57DRAFT_57340 [Rhizodiscina lignyota]|uniref:C3H1-type domain-containing protein n=1 Tax=Rhizodiscina lignyota TaxID=1504668 RepID=A0A9P4ICA7_9PEZI|nr:hypothetical protein NA57DRAFT_57340 [Rhizodiscina lignyota]
MPFNMLSESDLAAIEKQTDSLKSANEEQQNTLQAVLKQQDNLIRAYRLLKAELEAEKEAGKNWQEDATPLVLVLVDGNDYIFQKEFLAAPEIGGYDAAQSLRGCVLQSFPRLELDQNSCRIIVKMYLDLDGMSDRLTRLGITTADTPTLATFAADFNREQMFEIVDTGKELADVEVKIREDTRCKHIFFACCQRNSYLSLVEPYSEMTEKVSLIIASRTPLEEYKRLNLPMLGFPNVFCTLADAEKVTVSLDTTAPADTPRPEPFDPVYQAAFKTMPCILFAQGICDLGDDCSFSHGTENKRPVYSNKQVDKMPPTDRARLIAVNKYGGRVDPKLSPATAEAQQAYRLRIAQHGKLCRYFHLTGDCLQIPCPYDHNPVPEGVLHVMRLYFLNQQCLHGELCRKLRCVFRHTCERADCKGCSLKKSVHGSLEDDEEIAGWALAINEKKVQMPEEEEMDAPVHRGARVDGGLQPFGSGMGGSVSSGSVGIETSERSNEPAPLAEEEDLIDLGF